MARQFRTVVKLKLQATVYLPIPPATATLIHIQRQSHWQLAAPWGGTPLVLGVLQFAAMLHASLVLRFYCNIAL